MKRIVAICVSVGLVVIFIIASFAGGNTEFTHKQDWNPEDYPNYVYADDMAELYEDDMYYFVNNAGEKMILINGDEVVLDAQHRDFNSGFVPKELVEEYFEKLFEIQTARVGEVERRIPPETKPRTTPATVEDTYVRQPSNIESYRKEPDIINERTMEFLMDTSKNPIGYGSIYNKEAVDYLSSFYGIGEEFDWDPSYIRTLATHLGLLADESRRLTLSDIEEIYTEAYSNFGRKDEEARYNYITSRIKNITGMCDMEKSGDLYILTEDYSVTLCVQDEGLELSAPGRYNSVILDYKLSIHSQEYIDWVNIALEEYKEIGGLNYD